MGFPKGITKLTSTGATVTITAPTGPVTNLEVVAGGGMTVAQYNPVGGVTYNMTGSQATLDATNVTVARNAPASGRQLLTMTFNLTVNEGGAAAAQAIFMAVTHGTSTIVGVPTRVFNAVVSGTALTQEVTVRWLITGLTPGNSYGYDLAGYITSGGVVTATVQADNGASNWGPITMSIQDA